MYLRAGEDSYEQKTASEQNCNQFKESVPATTHCGLPHDADVIQEPSGPHLIRNGTALNYCAPKLPSERVQPFARIRFPGGAGRQRAD